jgi:formiminoglutamase
MNHINYIHKTRIEKLTNKRAGEVKIGERIEAIDSIDTLIEKPQSYVLLGIPEDIGVYTNLGKTGTKLMWDNFLSVFLNMQENQHNSSEDVLILGEIDCEHELNDARTLDQNHKDYYIFLGDIVEKIDHKVETTLSKIFKAGKIPIIIGGGHNNAYGIIKGYYNAFNQPINILNIDAHTDLRRTDYRHSGNGFSFALEQQMIEKYFIFGVHKAYTPQYIFDYMADKHHIKCVFFEDILYHNAMEKLEKLKHGTNFLNDYFGLEIDCDSFENFNASAKTSSGFSVNEMRNFINILKKTSVQYLHFCEGIPSELNQTAKTLSYFVSDFIRK